ncbi:peptidase domain-containing ABC transporter [Pedobacter insulae]|uniref:Bacteriocin-processing peptidase. Cysteine peptidase. MEROPS family C39 n=1 Tax=Pedobacter insulae TaxID=414048 RepID=A0A1I2X9B8_9SPHI|nr:peptidase domain-containing ABC transporter [Pedobacter insulae]SFH09559.1 bacteriocin-processing peptidase. Cysteine peptidase. MEROPS family C39 [Pedobacter insulae]
MRIKQQDLTDCGAACLASIAAHYKLKLPIAKVRQYANTGVNGTNLMGLIEAATKLGFEAKGVKGQQSSLGKIPLPAIAHTILEGNLAHYVVIYKVSRNKVSVMDPIDGKIHQQAIAEFTNEWTGSLLLLLPDQQFRPGNQKISNYRRFWQLIKPHQSIIIQVIFGSLIYTILGLSMVIFVQKITDYVLVDGNGSLLNLMGILMIGILLTQVLTGTIKNLFILRIGQQIDASLILGYYKHLLKLPQQFFDTMRVGEIMARVGDAVKIRTFINEVSIGLMLNIFIVLFSVILMFAYYWKLALFVLVIVPLYMFIYVVSNAINKRIQRRVMENAAELESQMVESLTIVGTIKSFGLEEFANLKIETQFIKLLRTVYKSGTAMVYSGSAVELTSQMLTIVLLWVGASYVLAHEITPGVLFSFYTLIGYFTGPAASLISANKAIQEALIAADRLFDVMDLAVESDVLTIALTSGLIGDIRFENVTFSYTGNVNVFENLSLNIKVGSFTAIVGESGSGKSTLMSLIQNTYPLKKGNIFIGQYDIRYFSNESLRNRLGVVPQKVALFAGNMIDNIAIGDREPNLQRIVDVCTQLDIIKFIESLPNGFQTHLGENGATLSGGQKQRIAIARALYRNPDILILDEATSSLDAASERYVLQTIDLLIKQHKTIIMITHRLSAIRHANHIVVLHKGRIMEEGSHKVLMSAKGPYSAMWQRQFGKY